jgi:hypothetical protein
LLDEVKIENKTVTNSKYDKIFDTFFKFDLKGYKADERFSNMIDDGLHTAYAAHCDYFITNDERCKHKAIKTYERLQIKTKVMTAEEFVTALNSPTV